MIKHILIRMPDSDLINSLTNAQNQYYLEQVLFFLGMTEFKKNRN